MSGQNLHNTRNQPDETIITPQNAAKLTVKWQAKLKGSVYATPAVADGFIYVPDSAGYLYKLDAASGDIVWQHKVSKYVNRKGERARTTPFVTEDALIFGTQNGSLVKKLLDIHQGTHIISVDKETGENVLWKKEVEKGIQAAQISQSAIVYNDRVYVGVCSAQENLSLFRFDGHGFKCCTHRGNALMLDVKTGEILHQEYFAPEGYTGAAVWGSTAVVDVDRNQLYVTTGNNYSVPPEVETCIEDCVNRQCDTEQVRACLKNEDQGNHFDSIMALDLDTLQVKWSYQALPYDAWNDSCVFGAIHPENCPEPAGPDSDFGQGPTMFTTKGGQQLVGAAQKSGWYWALNPDNGEVVWSTQVGPSGLQGGSEWGSATDGERIYVAISNSGNVDWQLQGNGPLTGFVTNTGFWSALDTSSGEILWQTPQPQASLLPLQGPKGPVTVANGVVFTGTTTPGGPDMFALDGATGAILWTYSTGGSVNSGAAVVDGVVYWGAVTSKINAAFDKVTSSTYANRKKEVKGEGDFFAFCIAGSEGCPAAEGS
jgi:polyvinyl alcohol dehydrogenase (cytochrome)